jgi:hypothetical protein
MDVSCPKCGQHLQAPDEADGKKVKCAKCGLAFAADATAQSPVECETTIVPAKIRPWRRVATVVLGVLCVSIIIGVCGAVWDALTTPSRAQLQRHLHEVSLHVEQFSQKRELAAQRGPQQWTATEERELATLRDEQRRLQNELAGPNR